MTIQLVAKRLNRSRLEASHMHSPIWYLKHSYKKQTTHFMATDKTAVASFSAQCSPTSFARFPLVGLSDQQQQNSSIVILRLRHSSSKQTNGSPGIVVTSCSSSVSSGYSSFTLHFLLIFLELRSQLPCVLLWTTPVLVAHVSWNAKEAHQEARKLRSFR